MVGHKEDTHYAFEERELKSLFETVRYFVWTSGGDGDGWIIAENYKELAGWFEEDENTQEKPWFIHKTEDNESIFFSRGQESIAFVSENYILPEWAGDIVVRSHHFYISPWDKIEPK